MARSQAKNSRENENAIIAAREHRYRMCALFVPHLHSFGKHACGCALIGVLGYFAYLSLDSLAGKTTIVDMISKFSASVRLSEVVAYVAAAVFGGAWWRTNRANKRLVQENTPRLQELEKGVDAGRSSSGLAKDGSTPDGDAL